MSRGRDRLRKGSDAQSRRSAGHFLPIPFSVLNHPNYMLLTPLAVKMLIDLASQLKFKDGGTTNNGNLCRAFTVMKERGWRSEASIQRAIEELLYYGFITPTKQGGLWIGPSLYAVTWYAIDECGGKLEVASTDTPSEDWKASRKKYVIPKKKGNSQLKSREPLRLVEPVAPAGGAFSLHVAEQYAPAGGA